MISYVIEQKILRVVILTFFSLTKFYHDEYLSHKVPEVVK